VAKHWSKASGRQGSLPRCDVPFTTTEILCYCSPKVAFNADDSAAELRLRQLSYGVNVRHIIFSKQVLHNRRCAIEVAIRLSVCLSVRLWRDARELWVKRTLLLNLLTSIDLIPYAITGIGCEKRLRKWSQSFSRGRSYLHAEGGMKNSYFRPISSFTSETVHDRHTVTMGRTRSLISRVHSNDLEWPWVTAKFQRHTTSRGLSATAEFLVNWQLLTVSSLRLSVLWISAWKL